MLVIAPIKYKGHMAIIRTAHSHQRVSIQTLGTLRIDADLHIPGRHIAHALLGKEAFDLATARKRIGRNIPTLLARKMVNVV